MKGREPGAAELRSAINRKCLECCCGMRTEVRDCRIKDCALHPLRPYQYERARAKASGRQIDVFEVLEAVT